MDARRECPPSLTHKIHEMRANQGRLSKRGIRVQQKDTRAPNFLQSTSSFTKQDDSGDSSFHDGGPGAPKQDCWETGAEEHPFEALSADSPLQKLDPLAAIPTGHGPSHDASHRHTPATPKGQANPMHNRAPFPRELNSDGACALPSPDGEEPVFVQGLETTHHADVLDAEGPSQLRGVVALSEGNVIAILAQQEVKREVRFRRTLMFTLIALVVLLGTTNVSTYFIVQWKSRLDHDSPLEQGVEHETAFPAPPQLAPTASPTLSPTGIPWKLLLYNPLVGIAGQHFGTNVMFANGVLAVGSVVGSHPSRVQFFQVDRETQQLRESGLPIGFATDYPEDVNIKMSADGQHLAISSPSTDDYCNCTVGKVLMYSRSLDVFKQPWVLTKTLIGDQPSFGRSLDISGDGARLAVTSNQSVTVYNMITEHPQQLGGKIQLWGTIVNSPVFLSITSSLLGIGRRRRPARVTPCLGSGCDEETATISLYRFNGYSWTHATSTYPTTLSNSGPYHCLGLNDTIVTLTRNRDSMRVFQYSRETGYLVWVPHAMPLGRSLDLKERINIVVGRSHIAVAWDKNVAVYRLLDGLWVQQGPTIWTDSQVTPSISLSQDGELLAVGTVDGNDSNAGAVQIYEVAS